MNTEITVMVMAVCALLILITGILSRRKRIRSSSAVVITLLLAAVVVGFTAAWADSRYKDIPAEGSRVTVYRTFENETGNP